jgi:hypothetical protein
VGGLYGIGIRHRALRRGYHILSVGGDVNELVAFYYSNVHDVGGLFRRCLSRLRTIQFFQGQAAVPARRFGTLTPVISLRFLSLQP